MRRCKQWTINGLGGLDWNAVERRLERHGLCTDDVIRHLEICEAALLEVAEEIRPDPKHKE